MTGKETEKDTKPKPFVFVLMPFSEEFQDVYELGIKPACEQAGTYCERVDEQVFAEPIIERVYNQIAKADLVVSEMTDRSPNVFYETGYAHALGKRVILLTQNAEDIPFDLKHYPHLVYEGKIRELLDKLPGRIAAYLKKDSLEVAKSQFPLRIQLGGEALRGNPVITHEFGKVFLFKMQNTGSQVFNFDDVVFVFEDSSGRFRLDWWLGHDQEGEIDSLRIEEKSIVKLRFVGSLFPDEWLQAHFQAYLLDAVHGGVEQVEMRFRILTSLGPIDAPFAFRYLR